MTSPLGDRLKTLTNQAENLVSQQVMPRSPENLLISMLALLTCDPCSGRLTYQSYWAYLPNPPLLQVVEWTENRLIVSTNDSTNMPPPWNVKEPSHPGEEEKLINISLGYEVLPLCLGPEELCINVSRQTRPASKEDLRALLGLFTALSLYVNHVYTTETLGKELGIEQRTICKGFTYKNFKYTPVHWDKCQAKSGKLFVASHTIVDWVTHGMWLSNCSDDISSTVCDYATQVAWKVTNTTMEHYKELFGLFEGGMASPYPRIVLDKQIGPEQWDIWKLAASTEELGSWTGRTFHRNQS
ncbi:endogenous retrovirus group K member 25 Env polyprotein-like [Muntiacus reevesi]|uniref:endogenous retrovirus group K member 25 Env polyprotein-like n=1 Tax=Muntiacus reevesi TaxID=9886 RepID=UPI003306E6EA